MERGRVIGSAAHDLFPPEAADLTAGADKDKDKEVLASGTELFAREYLVTDRMTGNGASMNGASA
jgi:hypothetical protein